MIFVLIGIVENVSVDNIYRSSLQYARRGIVQSWNNLTKNAKIVYFVCVCMCVAREHYDAVLFDSIFTYSPSRPYTSMFWQHDFLWCLDLALWYMLHPTHFMLPSYRAAIQKWHISIIHLEHWFQFEIKRLNMFDKANTPFWRVNTYHSSRPLLLLIG